MTRREMSGGLGRFRALAVEWARNHDEPFLDVDDLAVLLQRVEGEGMRAGRLAMKRVIIGAIEEEIAREFCE